MIVGRPFLARLIRVWQSRAAISPPAVASTGLAVAGLPGVACVVENVARATRRIPIAEKRNISCQAEMQVAAHGWRKSPESDGARSPTPGGRPISRDTM
jgi:hypothetical protein